MASSKIVEQCIYSTCTIPEGYIPSQTTFKFFKKGVNYDKSITLMDTNLNSDGSIPFSTFTIKGISGSFLQIPFCISNNVLEAYKTFMDNMFIDLKINDRTVLSVPLYFIPLFNFNDMFLQPNLLKEYMLTRSIYDMSELIHPMYEIDPWIIKQLDEMELILRNIKDQILIPVLFKIKIILRGTTIRYF